MLASAAAFSRRVSGSLGRIEPVTTGLIALQAGVTRKPADPGCAARTETSLLMLCRAGFHGLLYPRKRVSQLSIWGLSVKMALSVRSYPPWPRPLLLPGARLRSRMRRQPDCRCNPVSGSRTGRLRRRSAGRSARWPAGRPERRSSPGSPRSWARRAGSLPLRASRGP